MKMHLFGYSLLAGLMLATFSPEARSAPAPFDTASSRSEQLSFAGMSPQIVGAASADSLTLSWQLNDGNSPSSTKLLRFSLSGNSYTKAWEKQLPLPRLVGMTTDGSNFYIVSAAAEDKGSDTSANVFRPNILIMTKLDSKGNQVWQRDLNSAAYLGSNVSTAVYSPMTGGTGAVSYGAGKVIVALSSNTAADLTINARHQRAQYFAVSADGAGYGAAGETSWRHSFDQRLLFDGQDFVFTDLGDAGWYMPAGGITVRKIRPNANGVEFIADGENKEGTYIYARQSETAGNQNYTFTSIGDLELGAQGYLGLFTSETNNPTVSRNGWEQPVTEPRNLGFVHVTRNFETVREGKWGEGQTQGNTIIQGEPVSITITRSVVDSVGASRTFQRPDKPSKTFTQTGIVWLTDLPAGKSAERSKLVKVANDRYIAVWEEWNYSGTTLSHQSTKALVINEQGQTITGPTTLLNARLNPSGADRPFVLDGKAAWITGDAKTGKFTLNTLGTSLAFSAVSLDPNGGSQPQPVVFKDHLSAGDSLKPGDKLQSNNGFYTLVYQTDGNLCLYNPAGKFLWGSGTGGRPAGSVNMQTDGNFAMYGPDGRFQWNTGTTTAGSRLVLRDDGNLVIVTPAGTQIWATNTVQIRDHLNAGESLKPGEQLRSSNGLYRLDYQTDGNLVLYADSQALWSSGTNGRPAGYAIMQTDGNFVIYGSDNGFQWNTGTTTAGSWVVLQPDGNLVVHAPNGDVIWATNTSQ